MAVVQISDVIVPEVFEDYGSVSKIEKDIFVESGIAVNNARLNQFCSSEGGKSIQIPYFDQLASAEPAIGSDNPATVITPAGHTTDKDLASKQQVNYAWSSMDLAGELAGENPVDDIVSKVEGFWQTDRQQRLVYSINGVLADSVSNFSGDLLYDISAASGDAAVDANKINDTAIIEAEATMGDRQSEFVAMAVHSVVYKKMRQDQLIDYIRSADNNTLIATYGGKRLIVDDGLRAESYGSVAKIKYYSILFGAGAFAMAAGSNIIMPTEIDRTPAAGNGSGQETLYSRRQWIVHPYGYQWDGTSDPSYTNLEDGTKWTRAYNQRKLIKMAALVTNG